VLEVDVDGQHELRAVEEPAGGDLDATREAIVRASTVPIGTVPIYSMIIGRRIEELDERAVLEMLEHQARQGVDYFTIHAGVLREHLPFVRRRLIGIVSRGGSLLAKWMLHHGRQNLMYELWDEICEIMHRHDVVHSIGDGLRPGGLADATDDAQLSELAVQGELTARAWRHGCQVMTEGPGHVPFDQIEYNMKLQRRLCHGAPFYVLGPLVTDMFPGYDHITSAIGATAAAYHGAAMLCYVTPKEHLGLPKKDDVKQGCIAYKIAAHAADVALGIPGARDRDDELTKARAALNWEKHFELSFDPDTARAYHDEDLDVDTDFCAMCGHDWCSVRISREIAELLGLPRGTVNSRLRRGLEERMGAPVQPLDFRGAAAIRDRIGALIDKPRAPFAARFESELLTRLDQALGRAAEPLALIVPPPVYHSLRYLLEPIFSQEAIVAVATRLMKDLVHALIRDGVGARALRLALYRVDGEVTTLDIGLTMPTRDIAHVARLFDLKLERIAEAVEFGFGFEALGLAATIVEPIKPAQTDLAPAADGHNAEACAALVDRLQQRLGPRSVRQLAPVASHLPERAETAVTDAVPAWPAPQAARPLFLLSRAEPADVLALVPEARPAAPPAQAPGAVATAAVARKEREQARDVGAVEVRPADPGGHRSVPGSPVRVPGHGPGGLAFFRKIKRRGR